ncbi:hypothetical protein [Flagellimonas marinaquae]
MPKLDVNHEVQPIHRITFAKLEESIGLGLGYLGLYYQSCLESSTPIAEDAM